MRRSFPLAAILSFVPLFLFRASAQEMQHDRSGTPPIASIAILSNIDSAVVFIDAERVGLTPLHLTTLSPGIHHLVLQHPDAESWLTSSIADSFEVVPGKTATLRYDFQPSYEIQSTPFDAEVVLADSVLGTTPMFFNASSLPGTQGRIVVRKPGYESGEFDLSSSHHGVLSVILKKKWDRDVRDDIFRADNGQTSRPLHLTLAAAGTVLSGTAAAYFKIQADNRYAEYRNTGSQATLAQSRRLDTAAAIALVATQIGLGLITYLVLSD